MIPTTRWERRWRRALLEAMLPAPGRGLPALAELELDRFWVRFDQAAPAHLRLAVRSASCAFGGPVPWLLGYRRSLARLTPAQRDELLQRAARLPLLGDLLEVVKIVSCFAYFDDEQVQQQVRGGPLV